MAYHIKSIGLDWIYLDGGSSGGCGSIAIGSGDTGVVAVQGLLSCATDKWRFVVVADIHCMIIRTS